ncbi:ankyrin repeat-containing domain protein [Mycena olivaceomarginata]|nr:ankyrin repeat-containing domain protein [Mycena olivaceomarginata]
MSAVHTVCKQNNRLVDIQIEQNVVGGECLMQDWRNGSTRPSRTKNSLVIPASGTDPLAVGSLTIAQYTSWQDHPGEVLWIEGASGTGKTILSSMIIELLFEDRASLKSIDSTAIAYFYFDLGQQSVETACKALTRQYDLCNGQTVPNYSTLLVILEKMLAIFGRTYLVLDALDECRTEDYDRVTNFVATSATHLILADAPKRGVFIKWLSVLVSVTTRSRNSVLDADGVYRGDATVGLAHSSVQDYLQQHPTWCNSCPIRVREDMAHKLMAQTCVCHLLHFTDHPLAPGTIPDHPLATYAGQNWCYHLLRSSDRDRTALSTLAKQLLVGSEQDTVLWFYPEPPLYMCARLGYIEGVKFLLEAGADIDERGTALHYAAACKHMKIVEVLLEHGTDINVRDDIFGMTVLQTASKNGSIEMVRLLLQNGADINARDRDLHTITVWADPWRGVNRRLEIVRRLAENGAYVNVQGDTALQFASANGHLEIVRFLLENGADVGSALQCASENGYIEIVRLLLENGADVNAQAGGGYTEIVRLLLENGANVNACNGENETALHYASKEGYIEIVQLLVDNGATTE